MLRAIRSYCFVVAGVTVAAGAAARSRLGTWRLVHTRPAGAGADADAEDVAGRELAPLLASEE